MRGTSEGGQQAKLSISESGKLYEKRLGFGPEVLRNLPDRTDAPDILRKLPAGPRTDPVALEANMPKLPTPSRDIRFAPRTARLVLDLAGPYTPSKHGGSQYALNIIFIGAKDDPADERSWKHNPSYLVHKSDIPDHLVAFLDSGNFAGVQIYSDNEIVLNSAKVDAILKARQMPPIRNSCEYEPWQNDIVERGWRTLAAPMREYEVRAFKDTDDALEYWPHSMEHAKNAHTAALSHRDPNLPKELIIRDYQVDPTPTSRIFNLGYFFHNILHLFIL